MSCAADELEPPWSRYPWIPVGSIGWRMGRGEDYQIEWSAWAGGAITSIDAALVYLRRHPPAPATWRGWIAGWLRGLAGEMVDDSVDGDPPRTPWDDRVEAEELIEDDAAYPVFVRNSLRDGGMVAPWAWRADIKPYAALRYSARQLGWWARWLATECADRDAYLDQQPPPPPAWSRIERSARSGVAEVAWDGFGRDVERLVCTLVATGTLPPPWELGRDQPRTVIDYDEETADDRDYWLWWVTDTFDDRASWDRYLAPWPPPAAWQRALDDDYFLSFA